MSGPSSAAPGTASSSTASAPPVPPGQLTVAPSADEAREFLAELNRWVATLRTGLDRLDADAQLASDPDAYTPDIALAMSLCQSIGARRDELVTVWDSGRVGPSELARLAVLMWGRLPDPLGAASAFTLSEAGTLVVALVDRLTAALSTDAVAGSGVAGRITLMRAAIDRCRSQAEVLGISASRIDEIAAQLTSALATKDRERITQTVAAFDPEITTIERDLIKETSLRTSTARLLATVQTRFAELESRATTVGALAQRCQSRIAGLAEVAVPSMVALGPPPVRSTSAASTAADWAAARDELDRYGARLDHLAAALGDAEEHYSAPLQARDDLRGLLGAYETRAARSGLAEDAGLTAAFRAAHEVLWSAPCDLHAAENLVERYQQAVRIAVGADRLVEPIASEPVGPLGSEGRPV